MILSIFLPNFIKQQESENLWKRQFDEWKNKHPDLHNKFITFTDSNYTNVGKDILSCNIKHNLATRSSSNQVIQFLHDHCENLIGGSADLSSSDSTLMKKSGIISKNDFSQRT